MTTVPTQHEPVYMLVVYDRMLKVVLRAEVMPDSHVAMRERVSVESVAEPGRIEVVVLSGPSTSILRGAYGRYFRSWAQREQACAQPPGPGWWAPDAGEITDQLPAVGTRVVTAPG